MLPMYFLISVLIYLPRDNVVWDMEMFGLLKSLSHVFCHPFQNFKQI